MQTFKLVSSGVVLSLLALLTDSIAGYCLMQYVRSMKYSTVIGKVTHGEVVDTSSDDSMRYEPRFKYEYEIGGQHFIGTRYRYIVERFNKAEDAAALVKQLPVGSQVLVFYDPHAKTDSVLKRDISERELLTLLLILPVNVVPLAVWVALARRLRERERNRETGGLPVLRVGDEVRVRIMRYSPCTYGAIATSCTALLAAVLGGALGREAPTGWALPCTVFLMTLAVGGYAIFHQREKQESGIYDLVINKSTQRIKFPETARQFKQVALPLAAVAAVRVELHEDDCSEAEVRYRNVILLKDPSQSVTICHWLSESESSQLADWLKEELGVPRNLFRQVAHQTT